MTNCKKILACLILCFSSVTCYAAPHLALELGAFRASEGRAQNIGINGLIGDRFTITNNSNQNILLGLGYYLDGWQKNQWQLLYGVNAFYLAPTSVNGNVIQEHLFKNLSYSYSIANLPIYLAAKALFNTCNENYTVTFDVGVGPNFLQTSSFSEKSLDGGITQPDNIFSGQTKVVPSVMAGIGVKFNHAIPNYPFECGYRFFYLGQGQLDKQNSQIQNTLKTGETYAHSILCSINL